MAEFEIDLSGIHTTDFHREYLRAMFFTETGEEDSPLGCAGDPGQISNSMFASTLADCDRFCKTQGHLFKEEHHTKGSPDDTAELHAARDFWYTRNGHGCGFWDGDWSKDVADILTAASKSFGTSEPYIGDDGFYYLSGSEDCKEYPLYP